MTEQVDKPAGGGTWANLLWLLLAIALVLAGLTAYYTLTAQPVAVRAAAVIVGLVLGVGAAAMAPLGREAWQFALDSRVELRKMVWPTAPATRRMTLAVIVAVLFLAVFFWVVDWLLAYSTRHLLGSGA
jgi:preprotein translocase subunit SecE